MATKQIIEELENRLKNLVRAKEEACATWERNCQACTYGRLCDIPINRVYEQLEKARNCVLDEPVSCSKCKLVWSCSYQEARTFCRKTRLDALKAKCAANNKDCLVCPKYPCELDPAFYTRQIVAYNHCFEPYACRKCERMPDCEFSKGAHFRKISGVPDGPFLQWLKTRKD